MDSESLAVWLQGGSGLVPQNDHIELANLLFVFEWNLEIYNSYKEMFFTVYDSLI